jgi:AI-2 transport protein TqsA
MGLTRWGVPRPAAIAVVVVGLIVLLVGVGALIGTSVNAFTAQLPRYQVRLTLLMHSAVGQLENVGFLQDLGVDISEPAEFTEGLINPGALMQWAGQFVSIFATVVSEFLLVVVTTIFILSESSGFSRKIRVALGRTDDRPLAVSRVMSEVHHYLMIKTGISLVTGLLLGSWVWAFGVDFPVLWGLLAFLLNYIPNIGSIIAAVPPTLIGLVQPDGGLPVALGVALGFLIVNVVLGNFVEPRLMGDRLGLSTLVVFLSLVFWGFVWGGVGMLLSVPLTMMAKILLQNSRELRWIAVLLDKSPDGVPTPVSD